MKKHFLGLATLLVLIFLSSQTTLACTRILHKGLSAILVARNMDWFTDSNLKFVAYPRGIMRSGNGGSQSLTWQSKYGSIAFVFFDEGIPETTSDGMNERGLMIEVNALRETNYGPLDNRKQLSELMWAQYYLDNFSSVAEAIAFAQKDSLHMQPFYFKSLNSHLGIHISIADSTGDSAIIEYINGKINIHHNSEYTVMTNDPNYEKQLDNLSHYSGFGGDSALPGSFLSNDRFVRAAYFEKLLPVSTSTEEEIYSLLSIMENVSQPERIATKDMPYASRTIWRNVADLTHLKYYFQSRRQRQLISFSLENFDLSKGAPILEYYPYKHPENTGDISSLFHSK